MTSKVVLAIERKSKQHFHIHAHIGSLYEYKKDAKYKYYYKKDHYEKKHWTKEKDRNSRKLKKKNFKILGWYSREESLKRGWICFYSCIIYYYKWQRMIHQFWCLLVHDKKSKLVFKLQKPTTRF